MFGRIAPRYDLLNRVLSLGIDRRWRRRLLDRAGNVRGARVVDAACGTGDLTLVLASAGARVLGVDFTREMLLGAVRKRSERAPCAFLQGDALALPVRSGAADLATIAFGIRNVEDRGLGLAELTRVLRSGGRLYVLEFSMPRGRVLGALYRSYFTRVLPRIGAIVSGDRQAYRYLPDTVLAWPTPDELRSEMERAGLVDCGFELLTGGIACLSWGRRP